MDQKNQRSYGLFLSKKHNLAASILHESLINEGLSVCLYDCLCGNNDFDSLDAVISHPCPGEECSKSIGELVSQTQDIHFYVFAIMAEKRIKIIGEHPNLTYITGDNIGDVFMEILDGK